MADQSLTAERASDQGFKQADTWQTHQDAWDFRSYAEMLSSGWSERISFQDFSTEN